MISNVRPRPPNGPCQNAPHFVYLFAASCCGANLAPASRHEPATTCRDCGSGQSASSLLALPQSTSRRALSWTGVKRRYGAMCKSDHPQSKPRARTSLSQGTVSMGREIFALDRGGGDRWSGDGYFWLRSSFWWGNRHGRDHLRRSRGIGPECGNRACRYARGSLGLGPLWAWSWQSASSPW